MNPANNKSSENQIKKRRDSTSVDYVPTKKMKSENSTYLYSQNNVNYEDKNDKIDIDKDRINHDEQFYDNIGDQNQIRHCMYSNNLKVNNLNLLWKIQIPKSFLMTNYEVEQKFVTRDNVTMNFSLTQNNTKKHYSGANFFTLKVLLESSTKIPLKEIQINEDNLTLKLTSNTQNNDFETESSPDEDQKPVQVHLAPTKKGRPPKINKTAIIDESNKQDKSNDKTGQKYDIDISIIIVNVKNVTFNAKDVRLGSLISKEIIFPNEFNKSIKEEGLIIVIDMNFIRTSSGSDNSGREKLGYIGIVNEAMTCYMNSMLQTLNIINSFKKAVFNIPTQNDEYSSVALSLQRLFFDLMTDVNPVSTNKLIRSFGWGRDQIEIQHDVQEFNLLLSDIMEKKMAGTKGEGTFANLFEGKILNYIQCTNIDFNSSKEEKFCDLQLTVKVSIIILNIY